MITESWQYFQNFSCSFANSIFESEMFTDILFNTVKFIPIIPFSDIIHMGVDFTFFRSNLFTYKSDYRSFKVEVKSVM